MDRGAGGVVFVDVVGMRWAVSSVGVSWSPWSPCLELPGWRAAVGLWSLRRGASAVPASGALPAAWRRYVGGMSWWRCGRPAARVYFASAVRQSCCRRGRPESRKARGGRLAVQLIFNKSQDCAHKAIHGLFSRRGFKYPRVELGALNGRFRWPALSRYRPSGPLLALSPLAACRSGRRELSPWRRASA